MLNWILVFGILTFSLPQRVHGACGPLFSRSFEAKQWVALDRGDFNLLVEDFPVEAVGPTVLAQFVRKTSDGLAIVKVHRRGRLRDSEFLKVREVKVGLESLSPLPAGSNARFEQALDRFRDVKIQFNSGDRVAFRRSGEIFEAKFVKLLEDGVRSEIVFHGQNRIIDTHELSKPSGPARAVSLRRDGLGRGLHRETERRREFFNVARRVTSSIDFHKADQTGKLVILMNFMDAFFVRDHRLAYDMVMRFPDEALITGAPVCNQKLFYLGNILAEAGYPIEVERNFSPNLAYAHGWVLVRMGKNTSDEIYILDHGKEPEFMTQTQAEESRTEMAREFYAHPGRSSRNIY